MNLKFKLLSLSILLALSGCQTDDSEKETEGEPSQPVITENQAPIIDILQSEASVNEGQSLDLLYSVNDPEGDPIDLSVKVLPSLGTAKIIPSEGIIRYVAPKNVSSYIPVELQLIGKDIEHKHTAMDKINVNIVNSSNEDPTIDVSKTSYSVLENTSLSIPVTINDADGDELTFNYSITQGNPNLINIKPVDGGLELDLLEIDSHSETFVLSLSVSDGQSEVPVTKNISIVVNNEVSDEAPTISIQGGDSFDVNELDRTEITYTAHDPNTAPENLMINYEIMGGEYQANVTHDLESKKIIFENVVLKGDQTATLVMTVTDEVGNVHQDTATLNFIEQYDHGLEDLKAQYEPIVSKYDSIKNRNDELTIFKFYRRFAEIKNPDSIPAIDTLKAELETSIQQERIEIQNIIDQLNTYIDNESRDDSVLTEKLALVSELNTLVQKFGISGISKINSVNTNYLNNVLPVIDKNTVNTFEVENIKYYSRYVGNSNYGTFDITNTTWKFTDQYKFLEPVNVVTAYCQ